MSIQIRIRFAEPFWRTVGKREIDVQLETGTSVQSLLNKLMEIYPKLILEFDEAKPTLFIDDEQASYETILTNGDKVHIVWPIAGG